MYPRTWFDTYWRGTLKPEVFVAMPFADEFKPVWERAIQPAIHSDLEPNGKYVAHRVDISTLSGSIITEIFDGIAHATLVFADISVTTTGRWKGQRNGNVMYEVGLATAIRPETDIVIVKSDTEEANFDLLQIRVHKYPKDDPAESRRLFAKLMRNSLTSREKAKNLLAQHAWSLLDRDCLSLMWDRRDFVPFHLPKTASAEQRYAVRRLLELGIIKCVHPKPLHYLYVWTNFGKAVFHNPNDSDTER
jgi:hypothetical protein